MKAKQFLKKTGIVSAVLNLAAFIPELRVLKPVGTIAGLVGYGKTRNKTRRLRGVYKRRVSNRTRRKY